MTNKFITAWLKLNQIAGRERSAPESFAKHIADNFDADVFGMLTVIGPNAEGRYDIIDGQTRKRAAEIKGKQEVLCHIYPPEQYETLRTEWDEMQRRQSSQE